MAQAEPKIRIETREELIYLLAEAAEIEHTLMCCYLYAAWSLKRGEGDGLSAEQSASVERWRKAVTSVAIEEMGHLALACNLATAIGAGPHLSRPNFPIPAGNYPSGIVAELVGFSPAVLDHFIFLERPEGKSLDDSTEFVHPAEYHRTQPKGRLTPSAQDYATVGHLYRGIRHGMHALSHHLGEASLFCGDPASQIGSDEASLPGLALVTDLRSAENAIGTIVEQGEGAPGHSEHSHYSRFLQIRTEYQEFLSNNPLFEAAFPVARNPTMQPALESSACVFVDAPEAVEVLDLTNSIYSHVLRCLVQAFGRRPDEQDDKRLFINAAINLMELLPSLGSHLASLPASRSYPNVNAGVTFTMLRDVARLPSGPGEKRMIAERVAEIAKHAARQFPGGHSLTGMSDRLDEVRESFSVPLIKTAGY